MYNINYHKQIYYIRTRVLIGKKNNTNVEWGRQGRHPRGLKLEL